MLSCIDPARARRLALPLAGVLTALAAVACGDDGDAGAPPDAAAEQETRRVINVEVETLRPERFTDVIRLTGTVIADRQVTVAVDAAGTVAEVMVAEGDVVEAGRPLVRLDTELLTAQRDEARAQANLADQMWQRLRRLYEDDGVGTESAYLEARYNADAARARLAQMEERLRRMTVRAPFAGVVDIRHVELGSVVAPGTPVADLLDLEPLQVAVGVPAHYAPDVRVGSPATVLLGAAGDTTTARVSFASAAIDPQGRTFRVELDLDAHPALAKPQMVADVVLQRQVVEQAIVVPRQALLRTETGFQAFVVDDSQSPARAVAHPVELGASGNNRVVVTAGLAAGDRLVVVGQQQVANGDHVRVVGSK